MLISRARASSSSTEFEIRVRGILGESWSDYLGAAEIHSEGGPDAPVTVLRGKFQDQAALLGMLNTLYELGLPLLYFDCSDRDEAAVAETTTAGIPSGPEAGAG